MKYLDDMTDEELKNLGKAEKLILPLKYNRGKIMEKLSKKGYLMKPVEKVENIEKSASVSTSKPKELVEKLTSFLKLKSDDKDDKKEEVEKEVTNEKINFAKIEIIRDRRFSYYRNYPIKYSNKKSLKKFGKRYRFRKVNLRNLKLRFEDLNDSQIKRREIETEINKSKFDIGRENDIYFDREYLPNCYFVDEVVLMPKNPTTLYAYWEIREETFERLQRENGALDNVVIKIYKDGKEYRKITRHERIGSHFITDVEASQNYEAHIGYEDSYGNFLEIANSNVVIAPTDKISDNLELTWSTVRVDENTNQVIKYINSPELVPESEEFLKRLIEDKQYDGYTKEVLRKLRKVGASESIYEDEILDKNFKEKIGSSNLSSLNNTI